MCDASDFALGNAIHYASKTMTGAQLHYTTTEKEMLARSICLGEVSTLSSLIEDHSVYGSFGY
ncbi:hypothetical protein Tco_0513164, partial [Tanacetum coccineum]